jgi:ADP-heptose:LPS heptosyltransferase
LGSIQRLLLVLTTGLGDAILSSPVFPNLRRALPQADIRLFCKEEWLNLFRDDPNLNGIIGYRGQYRRFFSTIKRLKEFSPEMTLILHGNDPDIIPLAYLSGSEFIVRIPWTGTQFGFLLSNFGIERDASPLPGLHYIDNRLRILDTIGIAAGVRVPQIHLSEGSIRQAFRNLNLSLNEKSRYWIFHAFSADPYKMWPLSKGRSFLQEALQFLPDWRIVLTGNSKEKALIADLINGLPKDHIINGAGKWTLLETAAILSKASFFVGPDTGMLHLAAALEIPTIALFGPTSASLVGPRSATVQHQVIQKEWTCESCLTKKCPFVPSKCMSQIGVDEVMQSLGRIRNQIDVTTKT